MSDDCTTLVEKVAQLEARAREQLNGWVYDLRLVVHDNGIVLRGQARTYYAKQLAQHAVMKLTWLAIRANEIEVI